MLRSLVCALLVFHAAVFQPVAGLTPMTAIDHLVGHIDEDSGTRSFFIMQDGSEKDGDLVKLFESASNEPYRNLPHTTDMLTNIGSANNNVYSFNIAGLQNHALYVGPNEGSTGLAWASKPYTWYAHNGGSRYTVFISSDQDNSTGICWSTPGTSVQLEACGDKVREYFWHTERVAGGI